MSSNSRPSPLERRPTRLPIHSDAAHAEQPSSPRRAIGLASTLFVAVVAVLAVVASIGARTALAESREPGEIAEAAARGGSRAAAPVEVVFVLDNSGSMREHDPDFLTRQAVATFADALAVRGREEGFEARIGVVLFDEDVELALPLSSIAADSARAVLAPALARLDYTGQRTRSADGVERALYALRSTAPASASPATAGPTTVRQAIVLLTDGKLDTGDPGRDYDAATWLREDLAGESRERGIRIFGLAFTDRADYQLIQAVARKTDAAYYRAERAEELAEITANVLARLTEPASAAGLPSAAGPGGPGVPAGSAQTGAPPDVSSAPIARDEESGGLGRLGWLPILVLFVAAGGFFGLRARTRERTGESPDSPLGQNDLPPAQLLDVGGVLGETGRAIPLRPGRTRIGRDPNNDIVIADDTISSEHAVIELVGGRYWLEDLRSTNGTKHGDQRLGRGERVVLKGGDHVRFADIDLMFVFAGYVPGGATVLLPSTSAPPSHWMASRAGTGLRIEAFEREAEPGAPSEPSEPTSPEARIASEPSVASEPSRVEPTVAPEPTEPTETTEPTVPTEVADRVELLAATARDERPLPAAAVGSDAPSAPSGPSATFEPSTACEPSPTQPELGEATRPDAFGGPLRAEDPMAEGFRECLDEHLARVAELAPAFARLVERAFDEDMRAAIRIAAVELVRSAQREDRLEKRAYTRDRVRYVLCGAAGGMEVAARTYQSGHGGFTRFLSEEISSESFRADRCEILAVLTFGRAAGIPWVSLTVVPDQSQDPRVDLLSYELLTAAERQAIEPQTQQTQREVSQTGRL